MTRRRVRDATDAEAHAEATLLREEFEEADRVAAPFLAQQWTEQDDEYPAGPISYINCKVTN